jgi:hypothetical protein
MKRGKRHEARGEKKSMKRITLWLLATLFLANVSLAVDAQQTGKVPRIGFKHCFR